jgi:hypothetical protein
VGSVGCALALATLALARGSDLVLRVGVRMAAIAIVALVAALVLGWVRLLPVSLALLGGVYALYLSVDGAQLDAAAPVVAAGLLVCAELGYWSLEEREEIVAETGEGLRRLGVVAALGVAALLVTGGLLAVADLVRTRGLAVDVLGATAAAAALLVVVLFARRPAD